MRRRFDIGGQVIDKEAFVGLAAGELLGVLEEAALRLADADFVREDERVEVGQGVGELAAKLPGVQVAGVAAEQQSVASGQPRQDIADGIIAPEDLGIRRRKLRLLQRKPQRSITMARNSFESRRPAS